MLSDRSRGIQTQPCRPQLLTPLQRGGIKGMGPTTETTQRAVIDLALQF